MIFGISVIICSHNPNPENLRRTLGSLQAQSLPLNQWELLLVDNASREPLSKLWDLSWHPNSSHVREDEIGLTPARLCGIRQSQAALLMFVDDDNVLTSNYLATSLRLFQSYPWLGAFGAGKLVPEFQRQPHSKFRKVLPFLAIRTVKKDIWSNNLNDSWNYPFGAGLCVRREVASEYCVLLKKMNVTEHVDRRGFELTCGGDDLFSFAAVLSGFGFGLFPTLEITHIISSARVGEAYFVRLLEAHAFSHTIIGHLIQFDSKPREGGLARLKSVLSAGLGGLFDLRVELAAQRGKARGQRYIVDRDLKPVVVLN